MQDITLLLNDARRGNARAEELLLELVYDNLHRLAARHLLAERRDHTLQPCDLVNEAYIKLFGAKADDWQNRAQFYFSAARTMRRILIDYARTQSASKRPDRQQRMEMTNVLAMVGERSDEFIALDQALERLAACDALQAQIVELRFYGGLTVEETAAGLRISESTVNREWRSARAWLRAQVRSMIS